MTRFWGVWIGVASLLASAFPFDGHTASLEHELAGLVIDHPEIRSAAKSLEAQRKEIDIARAAYFPSISSTSESGHEFVDNPAERNANDGQNGKASSRTAYSQNLTVSQNLFDGFQSEAAMRTARLNKERGCPS